jgi:hypothetical protein
MPVGSNLSPPPLGCCRCNGSWRRSTRSSWLWKPTRAHDGGRCRVESAPPPPKARHRQVTTPGSCSCRGRDADLPDGEVTGELHHGEPRWRTRSSSSPCLGHGRRGSPSSPTHASCGGYRCPCRRTRLGLLPPRT